MKKGIFALAMSAALMLAGTSALADYTFTCLLYTSDAADE